MEKNKRNSIAILLVSYIVSATVCSAATLTVGSAGTRSVGEVFTVPVYVSTAGDEVMNTVEAKMNFPTDLLKITSVRYGTMIDVWPQKAAYSNVDGTISFLGIIYNPGFSGQNGRVLTVTFQALKEGDASVTFGDSSVLANDGQGTDILTGTTGTTVRITPAAKKTAPVSSTPIVAEKPADTHPFTPSDHSLPTTGVMVKPYVLVGAETSYRPGLLDNAAMYLAIICITIPLLIFFVYAIRFLRDLIRKMHCILIIADVVMQTDLFEFRQGLTGEIDILTQKKRTQGLTSAEENVLRQLTRLMYKSDRTLGSVR